MAASMRVKLVQTGPIRFAVTNAAGASVVMDGPVEMGGANAGLRPMEMLLSALAGCSSIDVIHIMKKQRQNLERLEVELDGERAATIPAVFTRIHLRFTGYGSIELLRFQKAVGLSMSKYCSIARMLQPTVAITAEALLE